MLPGSTGGDRHVLLHQKRHDTLQERLHQVIRQQWGVQCVRPVHPSQRAGHEGAGERLPPQVFHVFHLPEPAGPRRPVPLHQRQLVLRTRQTHGPHQRPFEFAPDEPANAGPEGMLEGRRRAGRRRRVPLFSAPIVTRESLQSCQNLPDRHRNTHTPTHPLPTSAPAFVGTQKSPLCPCCSVDRTPRLWREGDGTSRAPANPD